MTLEEQANSLLIHGAGWGLTLFISWVAFVAFLITDIVTRYGEPLIVQFSTATIIWIVALMLLSVARARFYKTATALRELYLAHPELEE